MMIAPMAAMVISISMVKTAPKRAALKALRAIGKSVTSVATMKA